MIDANLGTVLAFLTVCMLAVGQILFKRTALAMAGRPLSPELLISALLTPTFVLALTVYAVATVVWVLALTALPLSKAYPYMALSFVIVPFLSALIFGEPIGPMRIVGLVFVTIGVLFVARS